MRSNILNISVCVVCGQTFNADVGHLCKDGYMMSAAAGGQQETPSNPVGDAAYWRARAEKAEGRAEKLYQAAYGYWMEYTSSTYRVVEQTRLRIALEKALDDYDKGR